MTGIDITQVFKRFGDTQVLHGVSLSVARGEFIALLGPSGCGKTTLLRIIAGIESADEGRVVIGGRDVTARRAADRDIAMVFQSYALYPHLTVRQNIAVPLVMRAPAATRLPLIGRLLPGARERGAKVMQDVQAAAEPLGLAPLLDRRPAQLSGGQRQRVALARAIVRQPSAFLMDEPLSNLDAALRVATRREIVDIHRRAGVATIYVTHDQEEALTMADRIAVMQDGEILQLGTPYEVYAKPADLRVATFIGSPRINTIAAIANDAGFVHVAGVETGLRVAAHGAVTLALRPEALRTAARGMPAVVEHVEFLGDSLLIHTRHEALDSPLVLRAEPADRASFAPGARLALGYEAASALVFGADGKRLAATVDAALVPA